MDKLNRLEKLFPLKLTKDFEEIIGNVFCFLGSYIKIHGTLYFEETENTEMLIIDKVNLKLEKFKLIKVDSDSSKNISITLRRLETNEEIILFLYLDEQYRLSSDNIIQIVQFIIKYKK